MANLDNTSDLRTNMRQLFRNTNAKRVAHNGEKYVSGAQRKYD